MTSRRSRRTREEVRRLMLEAARDLFAERGFAGTTMRAVAERAGVTDQLLYNHFAAKEQLFAAAVVEAFEQFAAEHVQQWSAVSAAGGDPGEMLREYVWDLYELVRANRPLFAALGNDRFGPAVRPILERIEALTADIVALYGISFDPAIAVRLVYSAVTTVALHQDELLPDVDTERIVDEIATTFVTGLIRRA